MTNGIRARVVHGFAVERSDSESIGDSRRDAFRVVRAGEILLNCQSMRAFVHPRLRRARRSRGGFTFIELLYVVAIISILSTIAIPAYRLYMIRSHVAESLVSLGDAKIEINEFHSRWGRMPANNLEAGLRLPEEIVGRSLRSLHVSDGAMVASMDLGKDADGASILRTLTLRPWVNIKATGSPIVWSCGGHIPELSGDFQPHGTIADNAVEAAWLPMICRDVK